MELRTIDQRLSYIDHLRGFMFIIMAIDHALHAYAQNFGRLWFFKDIDRSEIFDMLYVFDQSIIMPMIFFTIGMFVISSWQRRGAVSFIKERLIRIGIPFVIGVPFIVPILSYPRFEDTQMPGISFFDFWQNHYFTEKLQGGPFWVMYAILLYTFILLTVYYCLPWLYRLGVKAMQWMVANPVYGFFIFGSVCAIVLGISDLLWGAFGWMGYLKIFNLQSSRILLVILYFFAGSMAVAAGVFHNIKMMDKLADNWAKLGGLMLAIGSAYMYHCVYNVEIAYGTPLVFLKEDYGNWAQAFDKAKTFLPAILTRTTLLAFLGLSQVLFLVALFRKFFSRPTPIWTSLACNAWGIFIIHESIVVWMQCFLINSSMPNFMKFLLTAVLGISGAWILSNLLRQIPGFRRVLGPQKFNPLNT